MKKVVIIGAGPAGITAGYQLVKESRDLDVTILEADNKVGGIAKTVEFNGNRMDLGGHRFFSKNEEVKKWWEEIISKQGQPAIDDRILKRYVNTEPGGPDPEFEDEVMLVRKRISSIYFNEKFFEYPVKLNSNTVKNLGLGQTAKAGFSYIESSLFKKKEDNLENFYMNHFGKQLYQMFFEGYTEKLWGRHPSQISADWGAQRMKGLTVSSILKDTSRKKSKTSDPSEENTSLSEEFLYPKLGPGQMWEIAAKRFEEKGGKIAFGCKVTGIETENNVIKGVRYVQDGQAAVMDADIVISSMPVKDLILGMKNVPANVLEVARGLPYRDFVVLGLLVPKLKVENTSKVKTINNILPDCWIYVQDTSVKLGRIQIYNNWSPYLVAKPQETVWIGLEYFCNEGDYYWNQSDIQWQTLAVSELVKMGIIEDPPVILDFHKEMVRKAYPAYFDTYSRFDEIKDYLNMFPNLYCIGRNGQHRYNNMDHTMMTAFETARNIIAGRTDKTKIWAVNMAAEYHESMGSKTAEPNKPIIYVEGAADNKPGKAAAETDDFAAAVAAAKDDSEKKKGFNPMMSIRDRLSIRSLRKPKQPSSAVNYALLSGEDETSERNSYRNAAVPIRSNYQEPTGPVSSERELKRKPSGVRNNATMPEDTYVVRSAPVKKEATFAANTENAAGENPIFTTVSTFEEPKYEVPAEKKAPEKKKERENITPGYYGDPFEDIDTSFYDTAELPVDEINQELETMQAAASEEIPAAPVVEEAPVEETVIEETPAEAVIEEAPEETIYEEIPSETVYEETPVETVYEETPVETVVEETPVAEEIQETVEIPAEEVPAAEEIQVAEEIPAEEAPVEETTNYVVGSAKFNPNEKKNEEPAKESDSTGTLFTPRYFREEPAFAEPVKPVYEEPVAAPAEPVYEEPVAAPAEPVYEEPVYAEQTYAEPAYTETAYAEQPVYAEQPAYTETAYAEQPVYEEQPVYTETAYNQNTGYDNGGYDATVAEEGYQEDYYAEYASRNEEYDSTYAPEYAGGYGYDNTYAEGTYYEEQPAVAESIPETYPDNNNGYLAPQNEVKNENDGIQKSNDFGSIFAMPTEDETKKKSTSFDMPYTPVAPTITIAPKKEEKKEFLNQTGFSKEKVEKVLKTEITLKPKKEEKKEEPQVMVVSVPKPSYHTAKGVFTPKPMTEEEKRKIEEEERAKRPIAPSINFKKAPEPPPEEEPKKQRPRKKNFARPAVPITADWESMNAKTLRELPEMETKQEETPEIKVQKSDLPNYDIYSEVSYANDKKKTAGSDVIAASIQAAEMKAAKVEEAKKNAAAESKLEFTRASGFTPYSDGTKPREMGTAVYQTEPEVSPVQPENVVTAAEIAATEPETIVAKTQNVASYAAEQMTAPVEQSAPTVAETIAAANAGMVAEANAEPVAEANAEPVAAANTEPIAETKPVAEEPKVEVRSIPAKKNIQDIEVPKDLFANARVIAVIKNGVKTSTTGDKTDSTTAQPVKKTIQKYTSDFETTTVKSIRKLRAKRQEEAIQSIASMLDGTAERKVVSPRPKTAAPAPSVANIFASTSFMDEKEEEAPVQNAEVTAPVSAEQVAYTEPEPVVNTETTAPAEEVIPAAEPVATMEEPAAEIPVEEPVKETFSLNAAKKMAEEFAPSSESSVKEESGFTLDLHLNDGSHRVVKDLVIEQPAVEPVSETIEESVTEVIPETVEEVIEDSVVEPVTEVIPEPAEVVSEPVERPAEETVTETAENPEVAEAPKKRTRKTKAASEDETNSDDSTVVAVKKPRKPRAKKTAEVENQMTLSDVSDAAAAENKPKRTYKRKPKTDSETPAETNETEAPADSSSSDGE